MEFSLPSWAFQCPCRFWRRRIRADSSPLWRRSFRRVPRHPLRVKYRIIPHGAACMGGGIMNGIIAAATMPGASGLHPEGRRFESAIAQQFPLLTAMPELRGQSDYGASSLSPVPTNSKTPNLAGAWKLLFSTTCHE